ncbi:transcription antitermination factor NusB [Kitasatospora purpeofusca]|uniref:transcription antitermination factor NusB n=1 Tax=Kitasatospora purpeofusca TaxID=67352 RepID=UPI000AE9F1A1|nr:transcription antitermination factor NusB [Kitasatospora purpeofusca]MCX4684499.1 transcription antitermination factor NusB [Kitasatospora purpeofusca]MCX4758212.1 transcription antitermination factor NusB [Kitasatospora purpeofusca]WSR31326.1 transcription antitermination factor NusB [Kitasatospora purpeofusca]WSR39350.1 transcription antitermination factor NusB [Kitasatospora purpeofusca]WTA54893.1 transcription antitermination factor NusB [Kitasatospora purpeofusca]
MSSARTKARTRAFQILFEADHRGVDPLTVLADWVARAREPKPDEGTPQVGEYTMELVEGYVQYARRIDDLISQYAVGWTLDRMPIADRNVLRLGTYELIWEDSVPDAVVVDEAVEIAKEYSTDDSPAFVNGLLARFMELKPSIRR